MTGRPARRLLAVLLLLALAAGAVWAVRPEAFLPPARVEGPAEGEGPHRVFGYATLTSPVVRLAVTGRPAPSEPATLEGFRREGRDILPDPSAMVAGEVFEVSTEGLRRLDRYERLGDLYARERRVLSDGEAAWVYRMTPLDPLEGAASP